MQLLTGIILVLIFLGAIYLIFATTLYFTQERFFFYPTKLSPNYPFSQFAPHQELFFDTPNDGHINALLFKSTPSKGIVFYSHGNSRSLDDWAWIQEDFTLKGYDVLIYDYRTFGKSKGNITEHNLYSDARYIISYLQETYAEDQIVIYGRSLGASIATQMATEFNVKSLILETPFSSMLSMVHASTPYVPVKYILRYKLNNKRKMRNLLCPVHILHGTQDELIPLRHAKRLYQTNSNPASSLTIVEGANHNNVSQYPIYHEVLQSILDTK